MIVKRFISQQLLRLQLQLNYAASNKPKSFMSMEGNIRSTSFEEVKQKLGSEGPGLAEQFRISGEKSLSEVLDGKVKMILDSYDKEKGEVVKKDNHFKDGGNHFHVFYNCVLLVERDLTLLIANEHLDQLAREGGSSFKGGNILIGNAESGVKALRFAGEIDESYIQQLTTVDKSKNFPDYFKLMAQYNKISIDKVKVVNKHVEAFYLEKLASNLSSDKPELYDFIDIDSFGSSIGNIRTALRLVKNGGVISAIFTDMSCLCGPNIVKCFSQYNIVRSKMSSLNENASRIIYSSILDAAAQFNLSIEPILTFKSDFYIKVFFRVKHSGIQAQHALEKKSLVYQCTECPNYYVHRIASIKVNSEDPDAQEVLQMNSLRAPSRCPECDSPWKINGPIWNGELGDNAFLSKIANKLHASEGEHIFSKNTTMKIQSVEKLKSYIDTVLEEKTHLKTSQILGFSIKEINGFFRANRFPSFETIKRPLARGGYHIFRSVFEKDIYKTNAPMSVIFDTLKGWKFTCDKIQKSQTKVLGEIQENSEQEIKKEINPALERALRKQQHYVPIFRNFSNMEKEKIAGKFENPSYLEAKAPRTVFYPNPTDNWGPKKPFNVYQYGMIEK